MQARGSLAEAKTDSWYLPTFQFHASYRKCLYPVRSHVSEKHELEWTYARVDFE